MGQVSADGSVILDQPHEIQFARLATLKAGLRLEVVGMKMKRGWPSAYSILKKEYGYKGTKQQVLDAVKKTIEDILA